MAVVRTVVSGAGLILDGLEEASVVLVAEHDGRVLGVAALEEHEGDDGGAFLLRSVAVVEDARGRGLGGGLTRAALDVVDGARRPVALLTESAAAWFPRFGFRAVDRAALPVALAGSAELRGACPVSARAFLRG